MSPSGVHTHQALFYRDDREYLDGLTRFLKPAVATREPVALVLPPHKLQLVREQLRDGLDMELLDMSGVGRNPGRILSVIERLREEHPVQTLHYVGEPIWPNRTPEEIREAIRHEALINVALRDTATRLLCPYDAASLDAAVLASAKRTHPEVVKQGRTHPSPCYSEAIPPECELPLSAPPDDALSYALERSALGKVRAAIRERAHDAGFGTELVEDLQIVANELATNAIRHGAPRRELTMWQTSERMVCQVENEGAILDPLAGRLNPRPSAKNGMGLWIVHQLSDLVEMRDGTRTTVRAHLAN